MFPFNLKGSSFFIFYIIFGIITLLLLKIIKSIVEDLRNVPKLNFKDPYFFAYLNGGEKEVVRLATAILVYKNILRPQNEKLVALPTSSSFDFRIEKVLYNYFQVAKRAKDFFDEPILIDICLEYKNRMIDLELIPSQTFRKHRMIIYGIGIAFLLSITLLRIFFSYQTESYTFSYMIFLMFVFLIFSIPIVFSEKTQTSIKVLNDLKWSYKQKFNQEKIFSEPNDTFLTASIIGLWTLPSNILTSLRELYPDETAISKPKVAYTKIK